MILNSKEKFYKRTFKSLSYVLCLLFAFVCLSFSFPLGLASKDNKDQDAQTSVDNMIMFASASEDTGASTAPSSEKGGCHYLGAGTKMTMSDGSITGTGKKYGGAVFISDGATFTMSGGTISGCTARYGGAIYVASGGTLNMTGGTIKECSATYAPAIYVEENATVTINGEIVDCTYGQYFYTMGELISSDTIIVGRASTGYSMHYLEFGYYPQTYVGDTMNTTLESWYSSNSPTAQTTYEIRTQTWISYLYTDGNYYARGSSNPYSSSYTYVNGSTVKSSGTTVWFKVEPIRWVVLNYDEIQAGTALSIDCLSEYAITSNIPFDADGTDNAWVNSDIRSWLNNKFINQAFTNTEQEKIATTTVLNNVTGDYSSSTSDGTGTTTEDKVYLLSWYETESIYFDGSGNNICAPTDFTISNGVYKATNQPTTLFPNGGNCLSWVRSAGKEITDGEIARACIVNLSGYMNAGQTVSDTDVAVRPAISFIL